MDTNILKSWIEKKDILNRTNNSFYECLNYYIANEAEEAKEVFGQEFDLKHIKYQIKSVSLVLMDWDCKFEDTVEVKLLISYKDEEVGYYLAIYNIESEITDDYLVFE